MNYSHLKFCCAKHQSGSKVLLKFVIGVCKDLEHTCFVGLAPVEVWDLPVLAVAEDTDMRLWLLQTACAKKCTIIF